MNKKTKIIILISLCILIAIIGIYFLFPKGSNTQNIYVQKVSTIIGSSNLVGNQGQGKPVCEEDD